MKLSLVHLIHMFSCQPSLNELLFTMNTQSGKEAGGNSNLTLGVSVQALDVGDAAINTQDDTDPHSSKSLVLSPFISLEIIRLFLVISTASVLLE